MKYTDLTGEFEDRNFIVSRGDSRIAITLAKNKKTVALDRTNRFLVDDPESRLKLAYTLSKPLKLGGTFNGFGVYKFVLQEVNSSEDDNFFLGIADYFKHFPKETTVDHCPKVVIDPDDEKTDDGREVWI